HGCPHAERDRRCIFAASLHQAWCAHFPTANLEHTAPRLIFRGMSISHALEPNVDMVSAMAAHRLCEPEFNPLRAALAGFALLATLASAASAKTWPTRPIRLIVPFAAGGANDIVARLIQPDLERALGQPVIIENKPAASGTVGTDQVAKAAPD